MNRALAGVAAFVAGIGGEPGDAPFVHTRKGRLAHRRSFPKPRVLALGLASAASLLLASCDSTTAQPRGAAAEQWAATEFTQGVVVVGTGNPDIDVPAVQAAVDLGGEVSLRGHFSFDGAPSKPCALCNGGMAMVLVSKAVTISGAQDGEMTSIQGGSTPFGVESGGARVEIRRPIESAIVLDNEVTMSAPEGTVFGPDSAAIVIKGFAQGNVVAKNTIQGRAGTGLSVHAFQGGIPDHNAFILNRFDDFEASGADVFVGAGVTNTLIVGPGSVEDHGVGTVILPVPF